MVARNVDPPCTSLQLWTINDGPSTHPHVKIITITNTTSLVSVRARGAYMYRIEAELLIPGHGDPIRDAVVILDGPLITFAGPASVAPPAPGARVSRAAAVIPGMWECHGHFLGTRTFDLSQLPLEPVPLRAARCARDLRAALDAGITSVREVGGLGVHLPRAVAEGTLDGPAVYGAGAILSTTGGHGDLHSFPLDWIENYARETSLTRLADGPD